MLKFLRDMRIRSKLLLLLTVFLAGFALLGAYSYQMLGVVKVSGPIYRVIVQGKDIIADILPPPKYIVESYLVVLQMLETTDKGETEYFLGRCKKLKEEYEERQAFWAKDLKEGEIKRLLLDDSYRPAMEFYEIRDREFIPAILAGDRRKALELAHGIMKEKYNEHRVVIDRIVTLSTEKNVAFEQYAASFIARRTLLLGVIIGIVVLGISIISGWFIILITRPLRYLIGVTRSIAAGDLTKTVDVESRDEIGDLARVFNMMNDNLNGIILKLSLSSSRIASSAGELSSAAVEMAAGAEEQTAQISQVATSIEEMSATVQEVARHSISASEKAKGAGDTAARGGEVVNKTVEGMTRVAESVRVLKTVIAALNSNSEKIGDIVRVIDDVADQTNLLALNAAIEAARAGEQGRGFAVVADEVRKLAERTTASTKEIADMVKSIQGDTSRAVNSMQGGTREVDCGVDLARQAGDALTEILGAADAVSRMIQQIATSSEQQSAAAAEISSNIDSITAVSKQNAQAAQQTARTSQDINGLVNELQEMVRKFKLRGGVAGPSPVAGPGNADRSVV